MAHEMKDWLHVRVKCPTCRTWVYTSWPPGNDSDHLVSHEKCPVFRIGKKEALRKQLAHAYDEEAREKLKRKPGIPEEGRRSTRQNPRRRKPVYEPERKEKGEEA